jgi:hypothetical protein
VQRLGDFALAVKLDQAFRTDERLTLNASAGSSLAAAFPG